MAKAKHCAYHLCGKPLERSDPRAVYCDIKCRRNALQWRWRHKKPSSGPVMQRRWAVRKLAVGTKKVLQRRRRPR